MRARTLWLLSLVVTALVVGVLVLARPVGHQDVRREEARPVAAPEPCVTRALAVLRDWDRQRQAAWAAGDPSALAALYTDRSRTAGLDLHLLEAYRARGLRVRSMHRQVLAVHVHTCRERHLVLRVTDRLVDAVAVGHGRRTGLPPGQPETRSLDLWLLAGRWQVSEVYAR